jgi:hypothetical protein
MSWLQLVDISVSAMPDMKAKTVAESFMDGVTNTERIIAGGGQFTGELLCRLNTHGGATISLKAKIDPDRRPAEKVSLSSKFEVKLKKKYY